MSSLAPALLVLVVAATIGMAWRDSCRAARARVQMLDACLALPGRFSVAPDGFPRFAGEIDGRAIRVSLIPDTFTVKRLPQLWLTMSMPSEEVAGALAVTLRPRGDDFFSSATHLPVRLAVPGDFPEDSAVRGSGPSSVRLLEQLRVPLAAILVDPRIKEVSLDAGRLRLVYQAVEGERGAHLLLRQARFAGAIDLETIRTLQAKLMTIEQALVASTAKAAA